MLTDHADALFRALEHQAEACRAELEAARGQVAALESENRALRERLLALAELEPDAAATPVAQAELPDAGAKARGLGPIAFRGPRRSAGEAAEAHASSAPASPLGDQSNTTGDAGGEAHQAHLALGAEHEPPSPQALLAQWYRRYPETFFKGHTQPLKTGIHLDLVAREPWPEKLVRRALACYVHLPRYLKAVRAGVMRVDLDGQSAGAVTESEARHARKQLDELTRKQKKQQKQHNERKESEQLERKLSQLLAKHGR
ncbi:ProP effector [Chromohalobacter marismortui]|uniref:ProP effector n=1 Tax=Chromohalobacter marismortui TaxID=42055 RepID=A0A4R7NJA1_9GAMM|nr:MULTISPECIES: ProQ/FINO family protein [Chromohalobacter]MCI0511538.1 ProQ/FINO family protein [Chromohalobacter sp.]MCI0594463.1 ProQ/FINO family protein [Chromohalobacter sp.]TDU20479.1 ProP effector [Chromohalobacter marismortui]